MMRISLIKKGGVKNLNGLVKEYFPKRSNFDIILKEDIYRIQEKLNNVILNYLDFRKGNKEK